MAAQDIYSTQQAALVSMTDLQPACLYELRRNSLSTVLLYVGTIAAAAVHG